MLLALETGVLLAVAGMQATSEAPIVDCGRQCILHTSLRMAKKQTNNEGGRLI